MSSDVASGVHVIFGSGPVGMAVMDELLARGRQVRLVKRSGTATVPAGVEVVTGDATDPESTRAVCKGAAVVYNCTNAPDYQKWPEQWPPLLAGPLEGAAALHEPGLPGSSYREHAAPHSALARQPDPAAAAQSVWR